MRFVGSYQILNGMHAVSTRWNFGSAKPEFVMSRVPCSLQLKATSLVRSILIPRIPYAERNAEQCYVNPFNNGDGETCCRAARFSSDSCGPQV